MNKKIIPFLFILSLISYTFLSFAYAQGVSYFDFKTFVNACLQTFISSALVFLLGFIGGFGLLTVRKGVRFFLLSGLLLPQLLPSNLFMSSILYFFNLFGVEFRGFWAVIGTHVFLNTGLASLLCYFVIKTQVLSVIDIKIIYNIKHREFILAILKSGLWQKLVALMSFFFLIHGLSFSIPLILTEELLTFEQILYESLIIGKATIVGVSIFIFYFLFNKVRSNTANVVSSYLNEAKRGECSLLFSSILGLMLLPSLIVLISLLGLGFELNDWNFEKELFLKGILGQLQILSIGTMLFFVSIFVGLKYNFTRMKIFDVLIPSVSFLIFSGFLLSFYLPEALVIGVSLYISIFIFIAAVLSISFDNYSTSREVLRVFNVKNEMTVFLKSEKKGVLFSFSLMSLWMGGDYVFSGSLARNLVSFGSLSRHSLSRYEILDSQMYSLFGFICSMFFILIFTMVVYGKNIKFSF